MISKLYKLVTFLNINSNIFYIFLFINLYKQEEKSIMTNITGIQSYDNMINWRQQHEINDLTLLNLLKKQDELNFSEEEIYGEYFKQSDKIGYEYDFMEGKDPNNEKDYNEQLLKLGEGDILAIDKDGDGEVSLSEYTLEQTKDLTQYDDFNRIVDAYTVSSIMFQIIDEGMGASDSSGKLSAEEFASYYKNLDQFKLDENFKGYMSGEFDGKINIDSASEMMLFLIDNIIGQETYETLRATIEKNLMEAE